MNLSRMSLLDRRYRVTHVLAQHDDETHYAARHVALDRRVRLIVSPSASASEPQDDICAWTMRAATLRHPILPRVRDCFRVQESVCVVLDEPRGMGLDQQLRERGPLTEREALMIGILVADALDYLLDHDATLAPLGCISLDALTLPAVERVALTYLRPRAQLARASACGCASCRAYTAPELLLGEEADTRSDLYSLAAVLRHALGLRPAPGPRDAAVPAPALATGSILAPILDRALATRPNDRFQSPAEFASALVEAGATLSDASPATGKTAPARLRAGGAPPTERPTDTRATPATMPRAALIEALDAPTSPASPRAPRVHVRHTGRRALSAIVSALHISA